MEVNTILSKNLQLFRNSFGYTQDDIANYLHIPREEISYFESGSRRIPVKYLNKLSDLFGIELDDLLEENPDLVQSNSSLAFRANQILPENLETLAQFKKIIKNYIKILSIENEGK